MSSTELFDAASISMTSSDVADGDRHARVADAARLDRRAAARSSGRPRGSSPSTSCRCRASRRTGRRGGPCPARRRCAACARRAPGRRRRRTCAGGGGGRARGLGHASRIASRAPAPASLRSLRQLARAGGRTATVPRWLGSASRPGCSLGAAALRLADGERARQLRHALLARLGPRARPRRRCPTSRSRSRRRRTRWRRSARSLLVAAELAGDRRPARRARGGRRRRRSRTCRSRCWAGSSSRSGASGSTPRPACSRRRSC